MPTILTKKSDTPGAVPATADLTNAAGGAELAVNTADKRLFTISSASAIVELGTNPSSISTPDASATVLRASSATITNLLATSASITTLTNNPTFGAGTANGVLYLNGSKVATSGSALVFDGSNLGIGVTPSAWSALKALQIQKTSYASYSDAGNATANIVTNGFYDGSNWIYINSTSLGAAHYEQTSSGGGAHKWFTAPSGTAGNAITFTQAMTLSAAGDLGLGRSDSDGPMIYSSANVPLRLGTFGQLRAQITAGGNLLVGTAVDNGKLCVGGNNADFRADGTIGYTINIIAANSSGANPAIEFTCPGSNAGVIRYSRNNDRFEVVAGGAGGVYLNQSGTSWQSLSDERQKTDLQPIENAANKVSQLRAVTGRYVWDDESKSRAFLIAQDVQAVLPEAVDVAKEDGTLGLSYTDTIPLLVAAIKEQQAMIKSLEAKVAALEAK